MISEGDKVPKFEINDANGKKVKSTDFKGKKHAIYFYPKDNTPGCTAESCNLRDNYDALQKAGYEVLGVSSDGEKSHQKFIAKHELPFTLIADEDKSVHEAFGTWDLKKFMGKEYMGTLRSTFLIDEEGKIEEVIEKVKTKDHTSQILK